MPHFPAPERFGNSQAADRRSSIGGTRRQQAQAADEAERSEKMEIVRKALASLNEKDRNVLLLWDAGFNYEEIAEQTGLSKGAIGTTLARARAKLVEAHGRLEGQDAASG